MYRFRSIPTAHAKVLTWRRDCIGMGDRDDISESFLHAAECLSEQSADLSLGSMGSFAPLATHKNVSDVSSAHASKPSPNLCEGRISEFRCVQKSFAALGGEFFESPVLSNKPETTFSAKNNSHACLNIDFPGKPLYNGTDTFGALGNMPNGKSGTEKGLNVAPPFDLTAVEVLGPAEMIHSLERTGNSLNFSLGTSPAVLKDAAPRQLLLPTTYHSNAVQNSIAQVRVMPNKHSKPTAASSDYLSQKRIEAPPKERAKSDSKVTFRNKSKALPSLNVNNSLKPSPILKKPAKRKPRTYSKAIPSQHCHVCSRRPTVESPHVSCGNLAKGRCRKTVCRKCFLQYGWNMIDAQNSQITGWVCSHCAGECPIRAQCHIYDRTSERRRKKAVSHRSPNDSQLLCAMGPYTSQVGSSGSSAPARDPQALSGPRLAASRLEHISKPRAQLQFWQKRSTSGKTGSAKKSQKPGILQKENQTVGHRVHNPVTSYDWPLAGIGAASSNPCMISLATGAVETSQSRAAGIATKTATGQTKTGDVNSWAAQAAAVRDLGLIPGSVRVSGTTKDRTTSAMSAAEQGQDFGRQGLSGQCFQRSALTSFSPMRELPSHNMVVVAGNADEEKVFFSGMLDFASETNAVVPAVINVSDGCSLPLLMSNFSSTDTSTGDRDNGASATDYIELLGVNTIAANEIANFSDSSATLGHGIEGLPFSAINNDAMDGRGFLPMLLSDEIQDSNGTNLDNYLAGSPSTEVKDFFEDSVFKLDLF